MHSSWQCNDKIDWLAGQFRQILPNSQVCLNKKEPWGLHVPHKESSIICFTFACSKSISWSEDCTAVFFFTIEFDLESIIKDTLCGWEWNFKSVTFAVSTMNFVHGKIRGLILNSVSQRVFLSSVGQSKNEADEEHCVVLQTNLSLHNKQIACTDVVNLRQDLVVISEKKVH